MNKAVFLDRDGVINEICYNHDIGIYSAKNLLELKILPGVKESIQKMKDQGFKVIVVSNQPGIAFKYIKKSDLEEINNYLKSELKVDAVYNCIHHPHHTGDCNCRKPKQGLLQQAANDHNIRISNSFLIGDNLSDIQAGKNCRRTILIGPERIDIHHIMEKKNIFPDFLVKNICEATKKILEPIKPQVVLIAAGMGTRMEPITKTIPKCMMPVKGKPLIEHQIREFARQGFKEIVFCVGYKADQITDYFKDGKKFGVRIKYSIEKDIETDSQLRGTAGAVKHAEHLIHGDCILYHADQLTNLDFNELLEIHERNKSFVTMSVRPKRPEKFSSLVVMDDKNKITELVEKPTPEEKQKYLSVKGFENNGIYVVRKEILHYIKTHEKTDFMRDVFPHLLRNNKLFVGAVNKSFYKELGKMERYLQINTSDVPDFLSINNEN